MTWSKQYRPSRKEYFLYYAGACSVCALVGWVFYRHPVASAALCILPFLLRTKYIDFLTQRKQEAMNLQFRDVLYAFSDSAASGRQAASAIRSARQNLVRIYGEEEWLTRAFSDMSLRVQETNESPERILMDFSTGCGIEDIRNFLEIYCICIRSGGDREKAIDKAADIISEKITLRQELRSMLVQKKLEAVILCCLTPGILFFLQLTSSDYAEVLYTTLTGRVVMTFCLLAAGFASLLCLKIMDIKI